MRMFSRTTNLSEKNEEENQTRDAVGHTWYLVCLIALWHLFFAKLPMGLVGLPTGAEESTTETCLIVRFRTFFFPIQTSYVGNGIDCL